MSVRDIPVVDIPPDPELTDEQYSDEVADERHLIATAIWAELRGWQRRAGRKLPITEHVKNACLCAAKGALYGLTEAGFVSDLWSVELTWENGHAQPVLTYPRQEDGTWVR